MTSLRDAAREVIAEADGLGCGAMIGSDNPMEHALGVLARALSADRGEAVAWHGVSDVLPNAPGWYLGCNYGQVEALRFDGNNWHHTRMTRDLAMPSHWCSFDSIARPGVPRTLPAECMEFVQMVGDEFGNDAGVRLRDLFAAYAATPPSPAESAEGVKVCTWANCTCDALHTTTSGEPVDHAAPSQVSDAMVEAYVEAVNEHLGSLTAKEWEIERFDHAASIRKVARIGLTAALAAQPQPGRGEVVP